METISTRSAKKAGWSHINSGPHLKKLEERCLSNMLAGSSESQRRFEDPRGFQGRLGKAASYKFWGEALDNLTKAVDTIFKSKKVL